LDNAHLYDLFLK